MNSNEFEEGFEEGIHESENVYENQNYDELQNIEN
jgi:hypothetical protein